MYKSLYIINVHEDDEMIILLGFLHFFFYVSKLWGFH
jgi:hypothetical protein